MSKGNDDVKLKQKAEINTSISISNTDVVTMLMVKNKKNLEAKRSSLINRRLELFIDFLAHQEKFINGLEKNDKLKAVSAVLKSGIEIFTKIPYKITYKACEIDQVWNRVDYNGGYEDLEKAGWKIKVKEIEIWVNPIEEENTDSSNEDKFYEDVPQNFTDCISMKTNFTFNIPSKIFLEVSDIVSKIREIDLLLKNENKMRDELIAKVTENAISASEDLQKQLGLDNDSLLLLD